MTVELVIVDLYGTLVLPGAGGRVRESASRFLERCRPAAIAVSTDEDAAIAEEVLGKAGLLGLVDAVYGCEDMLDEGRYRLKPLAQIAADFDVDVDKAVMIGDNLGGTDFRSARAAGVRFLLVPAFTEAWDPFDFDSLDLEPPP